MFLKVIWVSNICNGSGREVLKEAWDGGPPMELHYQWPLTIIKPSNWWLWQRALQQSLGLDHWQELNHHLGKWFPLYNGWFMSWQ